MNDVLDNITAQLRHFTHEETIALVCDFLIGLDGQEQRRFLSQVAQGPRPLVAESMGLDDAEDLLAEIQILHDAIANDVYVEYGVGYDPDYGTHRGFGDDSWIDEMDDLFAAATSYFRAGQFEAAAEAYIALFGIFDLSQDNFHFTRPKPDEALHTDVDEMKKNLFIAIGRAYPDAASEAIGLSGEILYYGSNRYVLLDAWQGREALMSDLEATLIELARRPTSQGSPYGYIPSHFDELLREFYRRYRDVPDYESLCQQVDPQRGWPYEDLVNRYREQENWEQVLSWAEDGLAKLPADSHYRPLLRGARGQALIHLDRPAEAFDELRALFQQRRTAPVYLKLRDAAQSVGRWESLYPRLTAGIQERVLAGIRPEGYAVSLLLEAGLVGYAHLLEGDCQKAVEWALNRAVPPGWRDDDLTRTVATGLLRMGLAAREVPGDDVLAEELRDAPEVIREHGDRLEPVARSLPAGSLLNSAVQLYERLVERAIGGKDRRSYAVAGAYCKVIRSIRRLQGREVDFERYYQGLFATYSRYSALKDELRKAVG